jgi:hypothetical protein
VLLCNHILISIIKIKLKLLPDHRRFPQTSGIKRNSPKCAVFEHISHKITPYIRLVETGQNETNRAYCKLLDGKFCGWDCLEKGLNNVGFMLVQQKLQPDVAINEVFHHSTSQVIFSEGRGK